MNERSPGHLLLCVPEPPDAKRQSGSLRLLNMVEMLRGARWQVTLVSTYAGMHMDRRRFLRLGVPIFAEDELGEVITAESVDVAMVAFWETAERLMPAIRARSPKTRIVIDSVDLHFVRRTRQHVTAPNGAGGTLDPSVGSEFIREMNVYLAADAVFTVSPKEARLLEDLTNGRVRGYCVPDCEDPVTYPPETSSRRGIVFVGNFQHPPNRDAVDLLCGQIVPHLDRELLAGHPISVVGNSLSGETLTRCHETDGVVPVGWVPSVIPYLTAARVSIVPLRYGAGTKRKVIQSLMAGTPTVATRVAVEGMGLAHRQGVWIEDEPKAFAQAVARLVEDEAEWDQLRAGGREAVSAVFDRQHVRRLFLDTLDAVIVDRPAAPAEAPEPGELSERAVAARPSAVTPAPRVETGHAIRPPIVIFGAPRSGTTYLNRIVNEHPGVFVSHESRLFIWAHRVLQMTDDNQAVRSHRPEVKAYLEQALPGLIREFYRRLRPQVEHWGDKNPHYASPRDRGCLPTIEALFPGTRFIHVIRDGRDVVASLVRKRDPDGDPWAPFETAHDIWNSHITIGHEFGLQVPSNRFLEIRYEDLIADDVGMARRVFDFLGIDTTDSVIAFTEEQRRLRTPLSGPTRDLGRGADESEWGAVFSPEERQRSLELLSENLVRFGYLSESELAAVDLTPAAPETGPVSREGETS